MKNKKILLVIVSILMATPLYAQKLSLGYLYPAGGEVGTTVVIEAGGLNINKATKVLFNNDGIKGEIEYITESATVKKKRRRLTDQSSPQLADRVKIHINIAPNVPCGLYDLRLQGPGGVSNMLPFEVASYPNLLEGKKSSLRKPNVVESLPAVLCGYVTPGGVDYFKFEGREGETIVASVKARQLVPYIADAVPGWFQPVLRIVDSRGREVAYADDYHHNVDPVIITTLPKDGEYTLLIHDAIYRGREDFNYRIQLGTIPFVTGRYPAYGVVGKRVEQQIEGVNLDAKRVTAKVRKAGYNHLSYTNAVGTSNTVGFYALPKGVKLIQSPKKLVALTPTTAISDSLTSEAKVKQYIVNAKQKEPIIIELIGRRNESRIDAVLRLKNQYGKVVAKADDTEDPIQGLMTFHADPVLKYTPKRDETLLLEVEDLHRGYGKEYHYLLRSHKQMPLFNAFVSPANITIPSGGTSTFRVDITGRLKRPANLIVDGLPNGFATSSLNVRGGKRWYVSITAPKGAEVKRFPIEVKMEYPNGEGRAQADVLPVDNMMQAFYYTHYIQAAELALDVSEPSPYRMSLDFDIEQAVTFSWHDDVIPVKVVIDKNAEFNEPVELVLGNKNKLFTLDPISIQPEETEKTIYITVNKAMLERFRGRKSPPTWQMNIVGTVKGKVEKIGKRSFQNAKYREMTPYFIIKFKN